MKNNNIRKHEEAYWHIPKIALLPILGLIIFSLLAWGNYNLIDKEVLHQIFSQDTCYKDKPCDLTSQDSINIYTIIIEYILISLALISLVASFKRGYNNLKSYEEYGLIFGLIAGLFFGLFSGLIVGLFSGLIVGLIGGLIVGLIGGLIVVLIGGLFMEFG